MQLIAPNLRQAFRICKLCCVECFLVFNWLVNSLAKLYLTCCPRYPHLSEWECEVLLLAMILLSEASSSSNLIVACARVGITLWMISWKAQVVRVLLPECVFYATRKVLFYKWNDGNSMQVIMHWWNVVSAAQSTALCSVCFPSSDLMH